MSLSIKGKIKIIMPTEIGETKAGKQYSKRSLVLDTGAQYNPDICFGMFGDDKCDLLEKVSEGQEVEVFFNLKSNEYNGKWYTQADLWKIDAGQEKEPLGTIPDKSQNNDEEDDDLPF